MSRKASINKTQASSAEQTKQKLRFEDMALNKTESTTDLSLDNSKSDTLIYALRIASSVA
jgi:hypothetical protein